MLLVGNARLHIFAVWRYGDEPKHVEVTKFVYVLKHGSRVFGTEYEQVDFIRCQIVFGDLFAVVRVPDEDFSFAYPVHEPFAVESGYISTHSRVDDHISSIAR